MGIVLISLPLSPAPASRASPPKPRPEPQQQNATDCYNSTARFASASPTLSGICSPQILRAEQTHLPFWQSPHPPPQPTHLILIRSAGSAIPASAGQPVRRIRQRVAAVLCNSKFIEMLMLWP